MDWVKPLKFACSISILLASVYAILRVLDASQAVKTAIAVVLSATMAVEMVAIVTQAVRGRPSHYNVSTPLDAAIWHVMAAAIVIALGALLALAVTASIRPLRLEPLLATAVRIGLWLVLLVAISGIAMAARGARGGLHVPHFFALHGLQALPFCAWILLSLPAPALRWVVFGVAAAGWIAVSLATLVHAMRA